MDPSFRVRVEVERAFGACESRLEVARHPWRKSLMNMMSSLRSRRRLQYMGCMALFHWWMVVLMMISPPKSDSQFDPAAFYEAVKPSTPVATCKWGVLVSALCDVLVCRWMKFYRFLLVKQKLKGRKSLGKF